ncbi:MAG TPA: hypothetical protein VK453_25100 [Micromonosporaceae bacterium]|nr:hypothetical protein [Micromonosporaceae bacterium]
MAQHITPTPRSNTTAATIAVVPVTQKLRDEAPDLLTVPDACHVITARAADGDLLRIFDVIAESDTTLGALIEDAKRIAATVGSSWGGAEASTRFAEAAGISYLGMASQVHTELWGKS